MSKLRVDELESLETGRSVAVNTVLALVPYSAGIIVRDHSTVIRDSEGSLWCLDTITDAPYTLTGNSSEFNTQLVRATGDQQTSVNSIADLLNKDGARTPVAQVGSYHKGTLYGGGVYVWHAEGDKALHNGGTVIDPLRTFPEDWSGAAVESWFTAGSGTGVWKREQDGSPKAVCFGVVENAEVDNSSALKAAMLHAIKTHTELLLPDFNFGVYTTVEIDGVATGFSTVRLVGSFATTGSNLGYLPSRCGTVILTKGNTALEVLFNDFKNENIQIKGVGFCDESFYPYDTPHSAFPAISILKGNPDGVTGRYITGNLFEDVAFVGYSAGIKMKGMVLGSVPNAALLNYIGPTSLVRVYPYRCGDAVLLEDCSLNHLWVEQSTFFSLAGVGVKLVKTSEGSGGNINVTYTNMVFEGMLGVINTNGSLEGNRNTLVLNSCDREFCGVYGPNETGTYAGNPLGNVKNTDIHINGKWTSGVAYGESSLPLLDAGSIIYANAPADISGGKPGSLFGVVNSSNKTYVVDASASKHIGVTTYGTATGYAIEVSAYVNGGAGGVLKLLCSGTVAALSTSKKEQTIVDTLGSAVTMSRSLGDGATVVELLVNNTSLEPVEVVVFTSCVTGQTGTLI